jgi:hypothetical protein
MIALIIVSLLPTFWAMLKSWRERFARETTEQNPDQRGWSMKRWDVVCAAVILLLAIRGFLYAQTLPLEAAIFPKLILAIISICAIAMPIRNLLVKQGPQEKRPFLDFGPKHAVIAVLIPVSGLVFSFLGFYTALFITMIFMPFLKYWPGERCGIGKLKIWFPVALIFTLVMFLVFHMVLGVPTPEGLLI